MYTHVSVVHPPPPPNVTDLHKMWSKLIHQFLNESQNEVLTSNTQMLINILDNNSMIVPGKLPNLTIQQQSCDVAMYS